MNKVHPSPAEAVADIHDGATIMFAGFGGAGVPNELIKALADRRIRDIIAITNNCGSGKQGIAMLFENNQIRKVIATFPIPGGSQVFEQRYLAGEVELELVPQGTLAERIRAGGAGIPAFYTPTGVGTELTQGREVRRFNGRTYVLELALKADYAFIRGYRADRYGNVVYNKTARNFNSVMATAADVTIAEVETIVPVGELEPESIVTPAIYVDRLVEAPRW
jgi:3-oxoadipate CoA-transferase alpha subunit